MYMVTTLGLLRSTCLAFFFLRFLTPKRLVLNATHIRGSELPLVLQAPLPTDFAGAHLLTSHKRRALIELGKGTDDLVYWN